MQLIRKLNEEIRFLLCVIDIFSKHAWVITLKDNNVIIIINTFQKILKESNLKPRKIWVDKGNDVKANAYINSSERILMKILNLKLVILFEYQNIETFLQKFMF